MIGNWFTDKNNLPGFEYKGILPYSAVCRNGKAVKLPQDPWFLMGNYQFTLFAHVSGEYEFITGQRSWGRLNFGDKPNTGINSCKITINNNVYELCGINSLSANPDKCRREFGCGYAIYSYIIDGIEIKRKISIKPSQTINGGEPAFVVTISVKNLIETSKHLQLTEKMGVHYSEIQFQHGKEENNRIQYNYEIFSENVASAKGFKISGTSDDPLLVRNRNDMSMYDAFPPAVFMCNFNENDFEIVADSNKNSNEKAYKNHLSACTEFTLAEGDEKNVSLIIGFLPDNPKCTISSIYNALHDGISQTQKIPDYSKFWLKKIPTFTEEKDENLRRELRWHVYCLESMATYSSYYDETKIPQGTIYDFNWGKHASARDNLQHALPCIYYNQALAKSTIRYLLKRTTSFGEIKLIEYGNGYAEHEGYFTSDQQLFLFLLLSEYLKVTNDYDFLQEKIEPFPCNGHGQKVTIMYMVEKCFIFLRDTIGCGQHGLVRLYNSDWNDTIYYIEKQPYNIVVRNGESHMNSAMVLSIFQVLIEELKNAKADNNLIVSMEVYRSKIYNSFMKDLGDRNFPRRMYFANKEYGSENMFLEPMGYTLQIKDFPLERKKIIYNQMKKRLYEGEKLGARQQQNPEFESPDYDKGSRENGGFWWALNGPVICGVATWDKDEAFRLLQKMTLENYAREFPEYWCGIWDGSDNHESSLIPEEGLSDQSFNYSDIPHCCAHPHAWILYCYWKIQNLV